MLDFPWVSLLNIQAAVPREMGPDGKNMANAQLLLSELWSDGRLFSLLKKYILGTSLAVQQLGLHHLMQGVWVQSLVRELNSHMLHSQKAKP